MNRIDFKINSLISYILQILVICSILCVLPVFQEILSVRLSERILALIGFCTCSIFFCRYHSLLDKVGWVYCISLLVISIVHTDMVTVENTFMSSIRWLNIFLLILLYKNLNLNTRWLLYFAFVFYITECGICIIEKLGKFETDITKSIGDFKFDFSKVLTNDFEVLIQAFCFFLIFHRKSFGHLLHLGL